MENHTLPLLNPPTAAVSAPPPNSGIFFRLLFLVVIALLSLWANHEASKSFAITILNESTHTSLRTRFHLFYVANDEATRILLNASTTVENFLYPPGSPKKPVRHVILRLSGRNSTADDDVTVTPGPENEFVLDLSPQVLEKPDFKRAMVSALRRGMTRVWLWDGRSNLVNGIVEYMTTEINPPVGLVRLRARLGAGATCWNDSDPRVVADFLRYGEGRVPGLVRRLTRPAPVDGGRDDDDEILENVCTEYLESIDKVQPLQRVVHPRIWATYAVGSLGGAKRQMGNWGWV